MHPVISYFLIELVLVIAPLLKLCVCSSLTRNSAEDLSQCDPGY